MCFCYHNQTPYSIKYIKYFFEKERVLQWDVQSSKGLAQLRGTCSVNFLFVRHFEVLKDIKVLNKIRLYIQNDLAFGKEYRVFDNLSTVTAFSGSLVLVPIFSTAEIIGTWNSCCNTCSAPGTCAEQLLLCSGPPLAWVSS